MANVVGEPFDEYVSKQIIDRQKIHGQGFSQNRDNLTLSYLNSRTSWLKLSSGVKIIEQERLKNIGLDYPGFLVSNLAKQFILFGGTYDSTNTFSNKTLHSGILGTPGNNEFSEKNEAIRSILNKVAYGTGGTEFGLRPMPGITSAETKFRERGSIREGTINIKAYNRTQLEIINLLYLRLGFPMLLEWGHSIIIDANGNVDTKPDFSISKEFLTPKYKTDNEVLAALEAKRKESAGNYDGMYGRVVNFDWSFNKDGSYDITLKLISIGAVIESLKANVYIKDNKTSPASSSTDEQPPSPETDADWLTASKYSHTIGNLFFQFFKKSKQKDKGISYCGIEDIVPIRGGNSKDFIWVQELDKYYIRLGAFWSLLQQIIPIKSDGKEETPIIYFFPSGVEENPAYTEEYQISSNPNVCLIGGFNIKLTYAYKQPTYSILPQLPSFKEPLENNVLRGKTENIYINTTLILQSLDNNKDENGDVKLFDFIKNILDSINVALGGVNVLTLIVDENNNNAKIIDETPIKGFPKQTKPESPIFNVFGYYENKTSAGFIRDFSLKTEITNNLVTMLTVGATANKSVVGEDATAFSKWNKGLEPIIGSEIYYPLDKTKGLNPSQVITQFQKENQQIIDQYKKWINNQEIAGPNNTTTLNIGGGSTPFQSIKLEDLNNYTDVVKSFINFNKEYNLKSPFGKNKTTSTSSKGFLPINFSLTMDGLSGIKIYQQIKVDTSFLPSEYPTALKFIIKGVSHKIDGNGWSTSIETVSVPVVDIIEETTSTASTTPSSTTSPTPADRAESRNNPNATNLRNTLSQLGYREKGKEIDSGGVDITSPIEKAASAILKTIKQELPSVQITVTGGNDKYHQELSYNSRHKAGNAVDFTVTPRDPATLDKIVNILQRYAAGNYPNFRFIDEYRNLTKAGTGNHFHISWGAGTESQNELNNSLALAKQGKITPIKIA